MATSSHDKQPSFIHLERFHSTLRWGLISLHDDKQSNKTRRSRDKLVRSLRKYAEGGVRKRATKKVLKGHSFDWFEDRIAMAPDHAPFGSEKRQTVQQGDLQFTFTRTPELSALAEAIEYTSALQQIMNMPPRIMTDTEFNFCWSLGTSCRYYRAAYHR